MFYKLLVLSTVLFLSISNINHQSANEKIIGELVEILQELERQSEDDFLAAKENRLMDIQVRYAGHWAKSDTQFSKIGLTSNFFEILASIFHSEKATLLYKRLNSHVLNLFVQILDVANDENVKPLNSLAHKALIQLKFKQNHCVPSFEVSVTKDNFDFLTLNKATA